MSVDVLSAAIAKGAKLITINASTKILANFFIIIIITYRPTPFLESVYQVLETEQDINISRKKAEQTGTSK
ncbi:MAG: hypothetical protein ACQESE_02125 [Nanobdellota archaeon]